MIIEGTVKRAVRLDFSQLETTFRDTGPFGILPSHGCTSRLGNAGGLPKT
jgi:hypothetical protein